MKILIVTQYFWPEEFRINDCAAQLQKRGHEVTVLTGIPNYSKGEFFKGYHFWGPRRQEYQGVNIIRVPLIARGKKQGWRLALNYLSFALLGSILGPLYLRGRFDIVFVYEPSPITVGIPAIVLKKMKRAPLIFWVQDLWPESIAATGFVHSPIILALVRKLVRWIYGYCDKILVQSKGFIDPIAAQGVDSKRIEYFPNWAEDFYTPMVLDKNAVEHEKLPKGFLIMFAGNMGIAQDFPTIINAAERLKNLSEVQWVILGDGSMKEWIVKEIKARGLEKLVHLLGRYPMETMPRFFSLADVMLVTLKRDPIFALTIPGKVQSYLACGKPIIAGLDGEGARVIQEAGAGIVCAAEDDMALTRSIEAMVKMSVIERQEIGRRGMVYYKQYFDRVKLIEKLENWMRDLIKQNV